MKSTISPLLYDRVSKAAEHARKKDDEFFAAHPRQVCRIRPFYDCESLLAEGMRAAGDGVRGYAIVIDHARAKAQRAIAGRAVYPLVIRDCNREDAGRILSDVARRWVKWFRKHSTTPPPPNGQAVIVQGRAR